jgi:hypothetical protein
LRSWGGQARLAEFGYPAEVFLDGIFGSGASLEWSWAILDYEYPRNETANFHRIYVRQHELMYAKL